MVGKQMIVPLAGVVALLSAVTSPTSAAGIDERGGCTFCAPRYVAVAPEFYATPDRVRSGYRAGPASSPYTRFDIEGVRLMTRMP